MADQKAIAKLVEDFGSEQRKKAAQIEVLSARDFTNSLRPAEWMIDGIVQRGWLYSCTALHKIPTWQKLLQRL